MLTAIHSAICVRGVVAMVPGNVVAGSWPSGGPAWLLNSRPLPYVLLPQLPHGLLPREITDEAADQAARADACPKAVEFVRKPGNTGVNG